jgi:cytochrome c-type biogenesis protein CcmH
VNPAYVLAAVVLLLAVSAAVVLLRRGRDAAGFALLVAAPIAAALPIAFWPSGEATRAPAPNPHAGVDMSAPVANSAPPLGAAGSTAATPTPADAARLRGQQARIARRFAEARDAFAEVTRLDPKDADAWADLADASAAASNGDLATGEKALAQALAIDPNHLKALWLQASLELQRKRYDAAAKRWEQLLTLLPPGSNDARVVTANLDEARALARGGR